MGLEIDMEFLSLAILNIRLVDVIDVILVAILMSLLYNLVKGSVAVNIFLGLVILYIGWKIVDALQMELLSEILGAFFSIGFIILIIIFQPEIREFFLALGKPRFIKSKRWFKLRFLGDKKEEVVDIDKIVSAAQRMSLSKQGALMIITRRNDLNPIAETGEVINADLSVELLENIFYPNSPLHDGAAIITGNKIRAARCILPVSKNTHLSANVGLRHRAALGITEDSDAIAVIVSEQTGKISYAESGQLTRSVQPSVLQDFLIEMLLQKNEVTK